MASPDDVHISLIEAIKRIETAQKLVDDAIFPTSAYLIERALDQMRADAWPEAINDVPEMH